MSFWGVKLLLGEVGHWWVMKPFRLLASGIVSLSGHDRAELEVYLLGRPNVGPRSSMSV